jgi:hypothetical protein
MSFAVFSTWAHILAEVKIPVGSTGLEVPASLPVSLLGD